MRHVGSFLIASDHPSLPGHFPGQPIVPGVLVLDRALELIVADQPGWLLAGLGTAKFTATVRPDLEIEVHCASREHDRIAFACHCAGKPTLHGLALLRRVP
jgi:3-hydroxyacyl-[acyl-carrier-protein] dehydratase